MRKSHSHSSELPKIPATPQQLSRAPTTTSPLSQTSTLNTSNSNSNMLFKTSTSRSNDSDITLTQNFESNWLPDSSIQEPFRAQISLKLSHSEIKGLRKSWDMITEVDTNNNEKSKDDESIFSVDSSRSSNSHAQQFNAQQFTSMLFCVQFYDNLISFEPTIERLIPSIKHQASAFAGVINVAIKNLEDLSRLSESLKNLGKLHSRILGIDPEFFQIMGEAFMKTITDRYASMKLPLSMQLEESWIKLYTYLANAMLQGGIDPVVDYNTRSNTNSPNSASSRNSGNTLFSEPANNNSRSSSLDDLVDPYANLSIDAKMAGIGAPGMTPKHVELPYQIHTSNSMQTLKTRAQNNTELPFVAKHGATGSNAGSSDGASIHTTISTSQLSMGKTAAAAGTTAGNGSSRRLRKFKKKTTGNEDCIIM
ncbi:unnamed protein product [Ambrosiozyma monospora]|uniref:Unnamed protein product n=1 Tax=Ambrosiozyma monospora TaxID=43982 RepID=A0ACB5TCB1_AMBMO|nr:unnamed protein product [Ambrosiozyma monospora]